eukprot:1519109-Karenia_brevis.AAC.1
MMLHIPTMAKKKKRLNFLTTAKNKTRMTANLRTVGSILMKAEMKTKKYLNSLRTEKRDSTWLHSSGLAT